MRRGRAVPGAPGASAALFFLCFAVSAGVAFAQVTEAWVARYNGPAKALDRATAVVLDADANVIVTGESSGGDTFDDYATIKYDSDGNELWVARYNGPGNALDRPAAIARDADGNIYVTGESAGKGTGTDYATVKYDAGGKELWVARYDGPANLFEQARAIVVDADGNVYVTGRSLGDGTQYDFATIKYDPSGKELWVARYDGPASAADEARAIALDADGNVYVAGWSLAAGSGYDFATIKYNPDGKQLWVSRHDGPSSGADLAEALALDNAGNVHVTGRSCARPGAFCPTWDYATIKYDSDGNELWNARYNGPGDSFDLPAALALDNDGNVVVTGESIGSDTSRDYATVKYDSGGKELWVGRYNGPGNREDVARALAIDADGNVYVTGTSWGGLDTRDDFATVKYDAAGKETWVARYNAPADRNDFARAIALDADRNVYVTGGSCGVPGPGSACLDLDYAAIKYAQK